MKSANLPDLVPARIIADGKAEMWLAGCRAKLGRLTGKLRDDKTSRPVIGDWVLVRDGDEHASINALLPRRTQLVRRAVGKRAEPQVIAANLDVVFIVTAVGEDVNPRRLERYLTTVWEGGATPIVVLNKADLATELDALKHDIERVTNGAKVIATIAKDATGADVLLDHLTPRSTAALVGSSGVGKSSLVNRLLGREAQATAALIAGERGRHTTTRRELFVLGGGAILIDTPGMRELGVMDAEDGLETAFADIAEIAKGCRFGDCAHLGDAGCAVQTAVDEGRLDAERFAAYVKLQREIAANQRREDPKAAADSKRAAKSLERAVRQKYRNSPKGR
ncbi:MAG: ribosome small subunit-dependent GTPase A [Myxococcota bacterium]|nr:ribosome small subunit-dependent GTPase A [Myxococcota bacterium]